MTKYNVSLRSINNRENEYTGEKIIKSEEIDIDLKIAIAIKKILGGGFRFLRDSQQIFTTPGIYAGQICTWDNKQKRGDFLEIGIRYIRFENYKILKK